MIIFRKCLKGGAKRKKIVPRSFSTLKSARGAKYRKYGKKKMHIAEFAFFFKQKKM